MVNKKQALGQQGEAAAAHYLHANGLQVIEQNWHCRAGEIDIVARDGETWVFAEVKSRRSIQDDAPFEAITSHKQGRMIRAAETYVDLHQLENAAWRIDVIAVVFAASGAPHIEHVKDALNWA
ncbi:MAG: YraN family protein [Anaerolineae bacterium]